MPTNFYFNTLGHYGEQNLIEDLIIESIKMYGIECYYLPKTLVNLDNLFGEDTLSKYEHAYPIEMFVKSVNGFEGDGDFLSKFGLEVRDEMVLSVAQRRFGEEVPEQHSTGDTARPVEGDLIYFPLNGKLFEIKFVEHEVVFYQMGKLQTYDLTCELYEYSSERLDTGIAAIDSIEEEFTLDQLQSNIVLERYLPIAEAVAVIEDTILQSISITSGGELSYLERPPIIISDPSITVYRASVPANSMTLYAQTHTFGFDRTPFSNTVLRIIPEVVRGQLTIANTGLGYANTLFANVGFTVTNQPTSTYAPPENVDWLNDGYAMEITTGAGISDWYNYSSTNISRERFRGRSIRQSSGYIETYIYSNTLPTSSNTYYGLFRTGGARGAEGNPGITSSFSTKGLRIVAINSDGNLVEFYPETPKNKASVNLTSNSPISNTTWHHILYYIDNDNNKFKLFVDGTIVNNSINIDDTQTGLISERGWALGSNTIGTYTTESGNTFTIDCFNGYMSLWHVNSDLSDVPFTDGTETAITPTTSVTTDANTMAYYTLGTYDMQFKISANSETLQVTEVRVSNSGFGLTGDPVLTLRQPRQTIQATAQAVLNDDNEVSSITLTNGGFGYLAQPNIIFGQTQSDYENLLTEDGLKIINEAQTIEVTDKQANNTLFTTQATDFIDFNDQNPFSEGDSW